ncbi:MAG: hypothetical protein IJ087_11920 [Eggerthellaceae bacterium]|nr:hypothetical protein [Eggerthellaceae bacterium]
MCFDRSQRRISNSHVVHAWTGPVPEGSFYQFDPHVFIASPEFIFLAAAGMLDFRALVALGNELCGLYGFDKMQQRGFRMRAEPVSFSERLNEYLRQAQGCHGVRAAKSALHYIVDRSASPMETLVEMLMCLPYRLGGYGLWKPSMNHEVPLDGLAARIAKRSSCYADVCWPSARLDVEYHGEYDHSGSDAQLSDRARVIGLREAGFEVIELTREQVSDPQAFEGIVSMIAKVIGKPIRKEKLGMTRERIELRRTLAAWNRSSGRVR